MDILNRMATDTLDNDIFSLLGRYGIKRVHLRLIEIMKDEYMYLQTQFEVVPATIPMVAPTAPPTAPEVPLVKKVRKPKAKKIVATEPEVSNLVEPEDTLFPEKAPEIKEVVLVPPQDRRDPKDWKDYQKKAEEAKHRENESFGIQLHTILTKENLKKWVEEEGQSYAWVAREKAGCPDTHVAATAQMMGIRSKITKKRGMILSGK
jgi:hypothetical protein